MHQPILRALPVRLALLAVIATALIASSSSSQAQFGKGPAKHTEISAAIAPATGSQPAHLIITVTVEPHWHVYSVTQPKGGPTATKIRIDESAEYQLAGDFHPTVAPDVTPADLFPVPTEEHHGTFMWVAPLTISQGVDPANLTITGKIKAQECDPNACNPFTNTFEARVDPSLTVPAVVGAKATASSPTPTDVSASGTKVLGLWTALGLAFLGGIVLNVMPCVLPVIGLKVLAFIEQGGQSRSKIFLLNAWYSAGVIAVWLALAVLATIFQIGLGQMFQSPGFNIVMAAVVFVMGLSFLGIWEIPIPGFIGTQDVTKLGEREGYEGAFAKGTITTLLATPCLGPFMGGLFIGLLGRPAFEVYAIMFAIGLGMASPYLVLGAVPQAMKMLPKPGAWMNTFKEVMGFLLIGTTVYLLTIPKIHLLIPTLVLLIGLGVACWWIGRVSPTAEPSRRRRAFGEAALVGTLVGVLAFLVIAPEMESRAAFDNERFFDVEFDRRVASGELKLDGEYTVANKPWQPYTDRKLKWLIDNNKPVLIDFTANWCPTCKVNEKFVLKTEATTRILDEYQVYTLIADWTHQDESAEVTDLLNELKVSAIPLVAIYRPGEQASPKLLAGALTSAELHEAIRSTLGETTAGKAPELSTR